MPEYILISVYRYISGGSMEKAIFLDIDGVLNNNYTMEHFGRNLDG